MDFKIVDGICSCCVLCRQWVGYGVSTGPFDVICMDCAEKIKNVLKSEEEVEAEKKDDEKADIPELKEYICPHSGCGEVFTSKGKYAAHMKKHKKEDSE